jgi:hypothetical protein
VRFDWLKTSEREIVHVFRDMSRSYVRPRYSSADNRLIEICLEMKNTWYMPVNIDFVPFLVNYASDYAVGTTYMALTLTNITFAGVSAVPLSWTSFILVF